MPFRRDAVQKARRVPKKRVRSAAARRASRLSALELAAIGDWTSALEALVSSVDLKTVTGLIEVGDFSSVLELIDWTGWEQGLQAAMRDRMQKAVSVEGQRAFSEVATGTQARTALAVRSGSAMPAYQIPEPPTPRSGGFYTQYRFDMTNPFAVAQVDSFAGQLVRQISETTRGTIKQLVGSAFREGFTADVLARRLRQTVGLTTGQALAVQRYKNRLLNSGMSSEVANNLADRYFRKTLKRRAETIARTEIMRASNFGRQQGWLSAVDHGLLSATDSTKEWITAPERSKYGPPCATCLPMDGVKVMGIETPFKTPAGQELNMPPAHPNCRCTAVVWPPEVPDDYDHTLGADLVGTTGQP